MSRVLVNKGTPEGGTAVAKQRLSFKQRLGLSDARTEQERATAARLEHAELRRRAADQRRDERERDAAIRREQAALRSQAAEQERNERAAKQAYLESRQHEVHDLNEDLKRQVEGLSALLTAGLAQHKPLDFNTLKHDFHQPTFDSHGLERAIPKPVLISPKPPLALVAWLFPASKERHAVAVEAAKATLEQELRVHDVAEANRVARFGEVLAKFSNECAELREANAAQNAEVDSFERAYVAGEPAAVAQYFEMALARDGLPSGFPEEVQVVYQGDSKQLVVERELPSAEIVPVVAMYRYVRTHDDVVSSVRPLSQIAATHASVIAQLALRTVSGVFAADAVGLVESLVLNGFVTTVDPATGKAIRPYLLTLRVTRDGLAGVDLARVDPISCLRGLNAQISRSPHELLPVRPIVDFNMIDRRFVAEADVLSTLEDRPNLAELTPGEFESLITNLFSRMGLETRLTQASRDGGVDCVAWDMRPIVGGKVIIQAKRYRNTVGVSAVRDLFGAVINEGAAKGILVATSGYGKAAFDFARNKPLELVSGSNLLYLLETHAGIRARIDFPEGWIDPRPDDGTER
jgi:restriction system protein